jgi:DNA-binding transcriptional MerR regulator
MTDAARLLLIGEFARRCRLPISTLRYYDRIGLLTPAAVDPGTGYRGYTRDQLATAMLIARLRALAITPSDIATVILGGAPATAVLAAHRRRVQTQIRDGRRALAEIDDLIAGPETRHPAYRLHVVTIAPTPVAAQPVDGLSATAVLRGIAGLRTILRRAGCQRTGPWGAALPLEISDQVGGFVFARTSPPIETTDLHTEWLPATRAVRTIHHGGPETVAAAYQAALDRIENEGWTPTEPVIEVYLTGDTSPIRLTVPLCQLGESRAAARSW